MFLHIVISPFSLFRGDWSKGENLDIWIIKLRKLKGCLLHSFCLREKKILFTITIDSARSLETIKIYSVNDYNAWNGVEMNTLYNGIIKYGIEKINIYSKKWFMVINGHKMINIYNENDLKLHMW